MKKFAYGLICLALMGLAAGCSTSTTNQATSNPAATSPNSSSPAQTTDSSGGSTTGSSTDSSTTTPVKAETVLWSGQSQHFKLEITVKSVATDQDFKYNGQGQAPSCSSKSNVRALSWMLTYLGDHPEQLHSIDFKTGGVPKYLTSLLPPDMQMSDPQGLQKVLMGQKAPLCLTDQDWAHVKSDLSNDLNVMVNTGPGTSESFTVKTAN